MWGCCLCFWGLDCVGEMIVVYVYIEGSEAWDIEGVGFGFVLGLNVIVDQLGLGLAEIWNGV